MKNFKLEYLYRDDGNYKTFGTILLKNNLGISLQNAKEKILMKLIDGEFFYPQSIGMKLFSEHLYTFDGWYEFDRISEADDDVKTDLNFDLFIKRLNRA